MLPIVWEVTIIQDIKQLVLLLVLSLPLIPMPSSPSTNLKKLMGKTTTPELFYKKSFFVNFVILEQNCVRNE